MIQPEPQSKAWTSLCGWKVWSAPSSWHFRVRLPFLCPTIHLRPTFAPTEPHGFVQPTRCSFAYLATSEWFAFASNWPAADFWSQQCHSVSLALLAASHWVRYACCSANHIALTFICRICFGLFLSMIDTSIVSTCLYTIGTEFEATQSINWVALAYTLAHLACAATFAQLSNVVGRRNSLMAANIIFLIFSLACGFSQTINQLIAFRALQGIGGSGT